jgi:hypothetical protein
LRSTRVKTMLLLLLEGGALIVSPLRPTPSRRH